MTQEWNHARRILSAGGETPRTRESCDLSLLKKQGIFLECDFVLLPYVAERSEFTSEYSLQPAIVICLYTPLWKNLVLLHVACPCDDTLTHVTPPNPQSINCLMLRIKLAAA